MHVRLSLHHRADYTQLLETLSEDELKNLAERRGIISTSGGLTRQHLEKIVGGPYTFLVDTNNHYLRGKWYVQHPSSGI